MVSPTALWNIGPGVWSHPMTLASSTKLMSCISGPRMPPMEMMVANAKRGRKALRAILGVSSAGEFEWGNADGDMCCFTVADTTPDIGAAASSSPLRTCIAAATAGKFAAMA